MTIIRTIPRPPAPCIATTLIFKSGTRVTLGSDNNHVRRREWPRLDGEVVGYIIKSNEEAQQHDKG